MKQLIVKEKHYYQNKKEVLGKRAKNKNRELSEENKSIKREDGRKRCHSLSEKEKQKLKEYQKNYYETNENLWLCVYVYVINVCFNQVLLNQSYLFILDFNK